MRVAIIGGGAAGFFAAITAKEKYPDAQIIIFEKAKSVLSKVRISGGGRCNLTNAVDTIDELCKAYPRGGKKLKNAFHAFSNKDCMAWFEARGVPLTIQDDLCVFPTSQDSKSVIDCFLNETSKLGVGIETGKEVNSIFRQQDGYDLLFDDEKTKSVTFDKVIVTTGGSPKRNGLVWLENLGHKIENPVPSLFTFNMPGETINQLMGIVVENAILSVQGTKFKASGPLLITHWGMSGPAVLKLSSFAARHLSEMQYNFAIQVNWVNEENQELVLNALHNIIKEHPSRVLTNFRPFDLPSRLWLYLLEKSEIPHGKRWNELGKKGLNKLVNLLTNDSYAVKGKTTFRDEYVTCGGVSLESIDMKTMQSKSCEGLYFAGEIMDIDAITGGFNLQAAWTTGYIAGLLT
ncbi:MAG: NAD(P)/FAD-dependent oxidoreductase [Bacteroidales bacterium]|nr:NAD(P)/FAD-dependent oxidoreductase [Bacteroidales bacterium]